MAEQRLSRDAQTSIANLAHHHQKSVYVIIDSQKLLTLITTMKLDSSCRKPRVTFLLDYVELMEEYNEQQTDPSMCLHNMQCMTFLQEAVLQDEHLHQIREDYMLRIAHW